MNSVFHGFRHYADFGGRDTRSAYWSFIICTHLISILLLLPFCYTVISAVWEFMTQPEILQLIRSAGEGNSAATDEIIQAATDFSVQRPAPLFVIITFWVAFLWGVVIILPTICATVRRLRDAGYSPWWAAAPWLVWVPALGLLCALLSLVTLVLCLLPTAQLQTPEPTTVSHDENQQPLQS